MKKMILASLFVGLLIVSSGCGQAADKKDTKQATNNSATETAKKQELTYLDKEYEVVYPTDKMVTASLEAMEDAVALDVQPLGAVSVSDDIPSYLKDKLGSKVVNVGSKFSPDVESIAALDPEVILGSTKFDDDVTANLDKIAPTINVSHQSTKWAENLQLMGELSGKRSEADKKIKQYEQDLKEFKTENPEVAEQTAVIVRVRDGELCVYGPNLYYNPALYTDLGYQIPEELKQVDSQTTISIEQFAKWNVDVIYVQFSEEENAGKLDFLDTLKENAIWKSIEAVSTNQVHYNLVDPGYQGGTYLSKVTLLEAVKKTL